MKKWAIGGLIVAGLGLGADLPTPRRNSAAPTEFASIATAPPAAPCAPQLPILRIDACECDTNNSTLTGSFNSIGRSIQSVATPSAGPAVAPIPPARDLEEPSGVESLRKPQEPGRLPLHASPQDRGVNTDCQPDLDHAFGSVPGPTLLDQSAVDHLYEKKDGTILTVGVLEFDRESDFDRKKATPLAPLLLLTDSHLLQQRAEDAVSNAQSPSAPETVHSATVWITGPRQNDPAIATIRRIYAISHVNAQVPATRAEWFTCWYGDDRIPEQMKEKKHHHALNP